MYSLFHLRASTEHGTEFREGNTVRFHLRLLGSHPYDTLIVGTDSVSKCDWLRGVTNSQRGFWLAYAVGATGFNVLFTYFSPRLQRTPSKVIRLPRAISFLWSGPSEHCENTPKELVFKSSHTAVPYGGFFIYMTGIAGSWGWLYL